MISDKPASDAGGNFGRLARYGVMNRYLREVRAAKISGVPVADWLAFFRRHASGR